MSIRGNPFNELTRESDTQAALLMAGAGLGNRTPAVAVVAVAAAVADGETVTVGGDVWEFENLNTDSTLNSANLDNTDDPVTDTYAGHTLTVGQYVLVDSEILRVTAVSGDNVTFARAQAGTTAASHTDGAALNVGDGITAGNLAVPLSNALTNTEATARLTGVINDNRGTEAVGAVNTAASEVLLYAQSDSAHALTLAETMGGAGNTVEATMFGGVNHGFPRVMYVERVPTSQEVTQGNLHIKVPFKPSRAEVEVHTTAAWDTLIAWDGATTLDRTNNVVSLDNSGVTDWAATHTVTVVIYGTTVDRDNADVPV